MKWMISNGSIIDGTNKPSYIGDIIIKDDTIIEIGNLSSKKEGMD